MKNITKYLIIYYLLILFVILSTSCHRLPVQTNTIKDSLTTGVKTVIKDSFITLPGSIVYDTIKSPCDSLGNLKPIASIKHSGSATILTHTEGNNLIIQGNCDSLQAIISKQSTVIDSLRNHSSNTSSITQIKFIPKLYKFSFWYMWGTVLLILGFIYYKLKP